MEIFQGSRKSGKTTRAILWMLQNWPNGVIVAPNCQIERRMHYRASDLTGLPPKTFTRNILCPGTLNTPGGMQAKALLLDDIQDFSHDDRVKILKTGKVVAYTECSP